MTSRSLDDYLDRITSRWRYKPKYVAMMTLFLQPFVDMQNLQEQLGNYYFDIDTAVGVQLDAVGVRVGLSRVIVSPLANAYFSWSDPVRGWSRGIWYDPDYGNQYGITRLDDDIYRRLLYAKILANEWDGTIPAARDIVDKFFDSPEETLAVVQDDSTNASQNIYFSWSDPAAGWGGNTVQRSTSTNFDSEFTDDFTISTVPTTDFDSEFGSEFATPSVFNVVASQWFLPGDVIPTTEAVGIGITIGVAGKLPPLPLLFLLEQQLVPVKALGAPVRYAFTSRDGSPLFGWGVDNEYMGGWSSGAWGATAKTLLNAPPGSIYPVTETA